jgi:hypothetical protein
MLSTLIIVAAITTILIGAFWILFHGLFRSRVHAPTPEWVESLSPQRYRPMERLLSERDEDFVRSFPGVSDEVAKQFRSERRRIFRAYLRALSRDFSRVCAGLRAVVATADVDRSELAILVARQQVAFQLALVKTEFRLALHAAGIGTVDTAQLLACFDSLRGELRQISGVAVGAAA